MEVWILLLAAAVRSVQMRDFTVEDIVLLHPSTPPRPGAFKCFTCQDAPDNYDCNRWAPDVYCPQDARFCSTLHVTDGDGASVSVTKRCAAPQDCQYTGCAAMADSDYKVCSSCCEGNICNLLVPRNDSEAVFSTAPLVGSATRIQAAALPSIIFISGVFATA
ncbi:ly6/PLAUR domain-containing protein 6-like [Salarias fasciatus]|nr:ly6/PLAUR domain-containing protein 6-like [Salarias fasciatus]